MTCFSFKSKALLGGVVLIGATLLVPEVSGTRLQRRIQEDIEAQKAQKLLTSSTCANPTVMSKKLGNVATKTQKTVADAITKKVNNFNFKSPPPVAPKVTTL